MRMSGVWRVTVATAVLGALGALSAALSACGGTAAGGEAGAQREAGARGEAVRTAAPGPVPSAAADPTRVPGVGDNLYRRIPADSRQVVAVYGDTENSPDSTVVLYTRHGSAWRPVRAWAAHNGRHGWTTGHRMGDGRSPVGVFTLTDAGGVLDDPGAKLPYDHSAESYATPDTWDEAHRHDFDYVIAIDYNRLRGTPPADPTRPEGEDKGGNIWLHLDHGSGTSACVSVSKEAMEFLLRTLDPRLHPVIVMGDRAELRA
ncbi:L,D-transpeptidase family protein [Streptomyces sp. NPDC006739]|uniref:L,D-transpeptidase family protein n=1 Tax=Streptomyces sp. NPDC006739 TaxID=3364763 RepID=UPI0036B41302